MPGLRHLFLLVRLLIDDRQRLVLENVALRHQLAVLKRSVTRPKIHDSDRVFWIMLRRTLKEWREALHFVKPDTVVRWHRKGFAYYWKRKSRSKPGRPTISFDLIHLIRRMSMENQTWGAPMIASELALLGHKIADSTVAKYMVKVRTPDPSQRLVGTQPVSQSAHSSHQTRGGGLSPGDQRFGRRSCLEAPTWYKGLRT